MSQELRTIASGVHVLEAPQRFYGVEVGSRMTALELEGGVLVHSPVAVDPSKLEHLGRLRWVMAPNLMHHLYVGPWIDAGLEAWAAPSLQQKRPDLKFHGAFESESRPFGDDLWVLPMASIPFTQEVVVLHRPSRTLIVSDLVFHFTKRAPLWTRVAMGCLCGYPGCKTTLLERLGMRRDVGRKELEILASWDFDRLIMAHGEIVEEGGKAALLGAFDWLLGRQRLQ